MKLTRTLIASILIAALALPTSAARSLCQPSDAYAATKTAAKPAKTKVRTVKLKARTLTAGKALTLRLPASAAKKARWSSSNKSIATVSSKGRVKAKKAGRCTIRAKVGTKTYTCRLTVKKAPTIASGTLRDTVFSLVSSAENSTLAYKGTYAYIEDIGDGRGYTCGIIGFTSGTGDLLDVVETYVKLKPKNNGLAHFVDALRRVNGTASHKGLGTPFVKAWKTACRDKEMIEAQNRILKQQYLDPAIKAAKKDGLGPLGQYIYYDALVVHGPGADSDSFDGIRAAALKKAKAPAKGGKEGTYLKAFLAVRSKVMLKEEAHSDLSRIKAQRAFVDAGNFSLSRPLSWTMYGDRFTLS